MGINVNELTRIILHFAMFGFSFYASNNEVYLLSAGPRAQNKGPASADPSVAGAGLSERSVPAGHRVPAVKM